MCTKTKTRKHTPHSPNISVTRQCAITDEDKNGKAKKGEKKSRLMAIQCDWRKGKKETLLGLVSLVVLLFFWAFLFVPILGVSVWIVGCGRTFGAELFFSRETVTENGICVCIIL